MRQDGIYVAEPSGGRYPAGAEIEVLWATVGPSSGQVRVEYSLDGGRSWNEVSASTPDDGRLTWTAPRRETAEGLVRVTDIMDASRQGESPRPFSLASEADVTLIASGAEWEYYDLAAPPEPDWARSTDTEWARGRAQLGYGEGDEATTLRDEDPNVPTAYFRQAITITDEVTAAEATLTYDDGFALFMDGTLVSSVNLDDGLDHDAYASRGSDDNAVATVNVDASLLTVGAHTVAVMVKQRSADSSDLSFDLTLHASVRVELDPEPEPGDAGTGDGDAGTAPSGRDAGPGGGTDAGGDAGGDEGTGGCGCRAGGGPSPLESGSAFVLCLWGAVLLRRRRRREAADCP